MNVDGRQIEISIQQLICLYNQIIFDISVYFKPALIQAVFSRFIVREIDF